MQAAVMRRLAPESRINCFDIVVRLLSWGFPEFTKKLLGPQFQAWTRCEKCLPHVVHLVKQARRYDILARDTQRYCDLLIRCSWLEISVSSDDTSLTGIGISMSENTIMSPEILLTSLSKHFPTKNQRYTLVQSTSLVLLTLT